MKKNISELIILFVLLKNKTNKKAYSKEASWMLLHIKEKEKG